MLVIVINDPGAQVFFVIIGNAEPSVQSLHGHNRDFRVRVWLSTPEYCLRIAATFQKSGKTMNNVAARYRLKGSYVCFSGA